MPQQMDTEMFSIRHATLPGRPGHWCVTVAGERIAAVESEDGPVAPADHTWHADGRLVSIGFIDPHVHLDKALSSDRIGHGGAAASLDAAIRAVRTVKASFTEEDVAHRAMRALRMGLAHGTTTARSHAEVDRFVARRALDGLQAAAAQLRGQVDLQLIAFAQEGWFETPGALEDGAGRWIADAVAAGGITAIGGNVNRALWPSDPERQVDEAFALAVRHGCDIDHHLDNWDGAEAFTLPYLAHQTIAHGWQGRVTVSHIASLALVPDAQAADTIDLVRKAGVNVCVLPTRMRLTRVHELMEAGVNVVCGTDNLRDPFVRFGDADPLKALLLLAQITGQLSDARLERLWPLVTTNAARALRLPDRVLAAGGLADLVVLDARSVPQAVLEQSARLAVFKRGRQVAGAVRVAPPPAAAVAA